MNRQNWIQNLKLKTGNLSYQLKIPIENNIPVSLLNKIRKARIGETITNPTTKGMKKILVTRKLKQRAVLALNLINAHKNARK